MRLITFIGALNRKTRMSTIQLNRRGRSDDRGGNRSSRT